MASTSRTAPPTPWSPIRRRILKAHYPTEFMAALLSSEMDGAERDKFFVEHIDDCRRMGIEVLPPNINEGQLDFRVAGEGKIHFGLGAIKGVGFKAVEAIVEARDRQGPFLRLDDLFERVPTKEVSAGCVETLIKAGAFDCLGARRTQLLAALLPLHAIQAGPGQAGRPPPGPARSLRRLESAGLGHATATATAMSAALDSCPTFPSCPTPSSSPTRKRCSASTCRATP